MENHISPYEIVSSYKLFTCELERLHIVLFDKSVK